jgi:hypothetical protein
MVHAAPSIEPSIAEQACSLYVLTIPHSNQNPLNEAYMADQIVITEKTARQKTFVPPWGLATETFLRPRGIYSTFSKAGSRLTGRDLFLQ